MPKAANTASTSSTLGDLLMQASALGVQSGYELPGKMTSRAFSRQVRRTDEAIMRTRAASLHELWLRLADLRHCLVEAEGIGRGFTLDQLDAAIADVVHLARKH